MKLNFPTRNEARSLIKAAVEEYKNFNKKTSAPRQELTANLILWYNKKQNIDFVTFVFTNALADCFEDINVDHENRVDSTVMLQKQKNLTDIESYFKNNIGISVEELINKSHFDPDDVITIKIDEFGDDAIDESWFNNSHSLIPKLLSSYQIFKKRKGMLFQIADIKQIPIDLSILLCANHYQEKKHLTKTLCTKIVKRLVDETNIHVNIDHINANEIQSYVLNDLSYRDTIDDAYYFLKQL